MIAKLLVDIREVLLERPLTLTKYFDLKANKQKHCVHRPWPRKDNPNQNTEGFYEADKSRMVS